MILFKKFNERMLKDVQLAKREGVIIGRGRAERLKKFYYRDVVNSLCKSVVIQPALRIDDQFEFNALSKIFSEIISGSINIENYFEKSELLKMDSCLLGSSDLGQLKKSTETLVRQEDFDLSKLKEMQIVNCFKNSLLIKNPRIARVARDIGLCRRVEIRYMDGEIKSYLVRGKDFEEECIKNIIYQMNPKLIIEKSINYREIESVLNASNNYIIDFYKGIRRVV